MTAVPSAHTALLLAIDPIVEVWVDNRSPIGDPLGIEHMAQTRRLSEVVRDCGWNAAFERREVRRLLCNIGGAA